MINTLLIDYEPTVLGFLQKTLSNLFPQINIIGTASGTTKVEEILVQEQPELVLMDAKMASQYALSELLYSSKNFELIILSENSGFALNAIKIQAIGYILKPIQLEDLVFCLNQAFDKLQTRQKAKDNEDRLKILIQQGFHSDTLGIPTTDGFEFICVKDIIRCEGMQTCTRIVTTTKTNIVSSYHIGKFKPVLCSYGFFSPHKSHIINPSFLKKYIKEGTIVLNDDSCVPVARRRKNDFLELIKHF